MSSRAESNQRRKNLASSLDTTACVAYYSGMETKGTTRYEVRGVVVELARFYDRRELGTLATALGVDRKELTLPGLRGGAWGQDVLDSVDPFRRERRLVA